MNSYKENPDRKVFNIDFDGTLTTGEYTHDPGPKHDVIAKVRDLYMNGHLVIIWTARWWENAPFLVSWLIKHGVPFHGVMMGKGGSDIYVDDKAVNTEEWQPADQTGPACDHWFEDKPVQHPVYRCRKCGRLSK